MDEMNVSSLPRSSNPPLDVVAPDTIPSERWVPYRNPQAQERTEQRELQLDPSGNEREDESSAPSSAPSPASDTNETNENSIQPDEIDSSLPSDLVEVTKRYAKRYAQSEEKRAWHWNLAPDGSFAMSIKTKKQKCRRHCRRNPPRVAPTVCYKESSDEEDLLTRPTKRQRRRNTPSPIFSHGESSDKEDLLQTVDEGDDEEDDLEFDDGNLVNTRKRVGGQYDHAAWEEKFQLLVDYKKGHGTTRVPRSYPVLGRWVSDQRTAYKKKKLPGHRIERLNSIDFKWNVNLNVGQYDHAAWEENYQLLVQYKKEHGTTRVPQSHRKLGGWVKRQRDAHKKNKLSLDRQQKLNSIDFEWNGNDFKSDANDALWMKMYQRLVEYNKKYRNTCVPDRWKEDPKLANWVHTQRRCCKERDRINLLNDIGFIWDPFHAQWMEMYQKLDEYKTKYGNTCVSYNWKEDPKLAEWVSRQRATCTEQHRIELLNDIGFTWDATGRRAGQVPPTQMRL